MLALLLFVAFLLGKMQARAKLEGASIAGSDATKRLFNHITHTWLFLLFFIYPSLSAKMLACFNCQEVHGTYYLVTDIRIECYTTRHTLERLFASVGLILYPFGIPFLFFFMMWMSKVPWQADYKRVSLIIEKCILAAAVNVDQAELRQFLAENQGSELQIEKVPTFILQLAAEAVLKPAIFDAILKLQIPRPVTPVSQSQTTGDDNEELLIRIELIQKLIAWAEEDKRGKILCRLPKLKWTSYKRQSLDALTVNQRTEKLAHARMGVLYTAYHTQTWWFELVDLLRKLLLTGLIVFVGTGSAAQVAVGTFICTLMAYVGIHLDPFLDPDLNRFNNLCLIQLNITLFIGLLLKVDTLRDGERSTKTLASFVIFLSVFILFFPIVMIIVNKLMKKTKSANSARRWSTQALDNTLFLRKDASMYGHNCKVVTLKKRTEEEVLRDNEELIVSKDVTTEEKSVTPDEIVVDLQQIPVSGLGGSEADAELISPKSSEVTVEIAFGSEVLSEPSETKKIPPKIIVDFQDSKSGLPNSETASAPPLEDEVSVMSAERKT